MSLKRKIERSCIEYPSRVFKPVQIPFTELRIQKLTKEEITALYYCDFMGLKQQEAANKMGISQASLSREIELVRKKIACALFHGQAIQFESDIKIEEEETI